MAVDKGATIACTSLVGVDLVAAACSPERPHLITSDMNYPPGESLCRMIGGFSGNDPDPVLWSDVTDIDGKEAEETASAGDVDVSARSASAATQFALQALGCPTGCRASICWPGTATCPISR